MLLPLQAQTDTLRTFIFTGSQLPASIIPARDSFSTLVKQALPMASMAEWLGRENGVFIKNYGPGNIATITQRGLGAAHTAVLWHGINIQNNTLGTIDFALFIKNIPGMLAQSFRQSINTDSRTFEIVCYGISKEFQLFSAIRQCLLRFGMAARQHQFPGGRQRYGRRPGTGPRRST